MGGGVMSTIKANQWLNSDGTENFKCRAWVNFDSLTGTVTIKASGNVSSITDSGVGKFIINFSSVLSDINYAWVGSARSTNNGAASQTLISQALDNNTKTTSSLGINANIVTTPTDSYDISVAIFR